MDEVLEYLDSRHMGYKLVDGVRGKEAICKICPYCHDKEGHFYFNVSNKVFYCHKCEAKGTLLTLKGDLGDLAPVSSFKDLSTDKETKAIIALDEIEQAHTSLLQNGDALKYLHSRKLSMEAINYFRLGLSVEGSVTWLWFPYFINGVPVNVKKRALPPHPKAFKKIVGGISSLYNVDTLAPNTEDIVIVEGEMDCIALWSAGMRNVVSVPDGAGTFRPEDIDKLDKVSKIYIVPDNDDPGIEGAYKVANRLGIERCYKVIMPFGIKDVDQFFQNKYTLEQFIKLLLAARQFNVQYVSSLGEEVSKMIYRLTSPEKEEKDTIHLPWKKLDKLINGFEPGDLISVAGRPGVGKTSFALNLIYQFSKMNVPSMLFEMEMRPQRIVPRIISMHMGIDSTNVMQVDVAQTAFKELKDFPFLFAYNYKKPSFDFCADTIRKAFNRYGLRFLVFDNLHFLVRSKTDQTKEVSFVVQSFKLLAEELAIPILLIARPRKSNNKIITNEDLKDSSDIEGDSDLVILLHREPKRGAEGNYTNEEGIFDSKLLVRVSKARYSSGGDCNLIMDDKQCRLMEE